MVEEDGGYSQEGNYFGDFSYEEWVAKEMREAYPTTESALQQLEMGPSLEAAVAFFWHVFERPGLDELFSGTMRPHELDRMMEHIRKASPENWEDVENQRAWEEVRKLTLQEYTSKRDSLLERIERITNDLQPELVPDDKLPELDVWSFVHVAAAFALCLERLEEAQTEHFWQIVESALAITKRPLNLARIAEYNLDADISPHLVRILLLGKLFHKHLLYGEYEESLERLYEASRLCRQIDGDLYEWHGADVVRIDDWMDLGFWNRRSPALEAQGTGIHLVAQIVPAQTAVDAFDQLLEVSPASTNWEHIASLCYVIRMIWEEPTPDCEVKSKHLPIKESARNFWLVARGLVLQKMNPHSLADYVEQLQKSQFEARLQTYFFGDLWEFLPEKARQGLVSADREYEFSGGRQAIVFDHLRHTVRAILVDILWEPFQAWLQTQPQKKVFRSFAEVAQVLTRDEPDLRPLVDLWPTAEFQSFLNSSFRKDQVSFLGSVEGDLKHLNRLANEESHQHSRSSQSFENEVRKEYQKFLGIGQQGIIPRLLQLKRDAQDSGK